MSAPSPIDVIAGSTIVAAPISDSSNKPEFMARTSRDNSLKRSTDISAQIAAGIARIKATPRMNSSASSSEAPKALPVCRASA